MDSTSSVSFHKRISAAGVLIATGIVFGDIGTSPLYTLNAVFHNRVITEDVALGSLSAIFWTLFFQTTLKYVIITLQADNKGEGGIFSLYALIRRFSGRWLLFPAMAGGAFLMADGIITPPISVASAIEGLQAINPHMQTEGIVIGILIILFLFQQFGTEKIGKITIIASQALISGCFTLINEAIRLDIWPRHRVLFPGNIKGQIYIPFINWFLMAGCIGMVLYFRESTRMEAAFGLSVTLTMLMSTVLINFYLRAKRVPLLAVVAITGLFLFIELSFLIANFRKIKDGGWLTLLIGSCLFGIMFVWYKGRRIKNAMINLVPCDQYIALLKRLSADAHIPKYATNLVYLTSSGTSKMIEKTAIDSILSKSPKRADIYWFLHVNVLDEPYAEFRS